MCVCKLSIESFPDWSIKLLTGANKYVPVSMIVLFLYDYIIKQLVLLLITYKYDARGDTFVQ